MDLKDEAEQLLSSNQAIYEEMLNYVNKYRQEVWSSPLVLDDDLSLVATIRACAMNYSGIFSHTRPNWTMCNTVINELNFSKSWSQWENIAYWSTDTEETAIMWRNSEWHYQNMIDTKFGKLWVGNCWAYWVQFFN